MKTFKAVAADAIATWFAILMWWLPGFLLVAIAGHAGAPIIAWLFAHNVVVPLQMGPVANGLAVLIAASTLGVMVRKAEERGRVAGATTTARMALSHLLGTSAQVPPEQALMRAQSAVDTMRRVIDRGGRWEP